MLRRLFYGCIVLGIIGLAVFFFLTSPTTIAATDVPGSAGDVKKGEIQIASTPSDAMWGRRLVIPGRSPIPSPLLS